MAIILVTHDLGVVAEMAHRVAVMYTWGLLDCLPRLDAAGRRRLQSIEGQPPHLMTPIAGCAFAARCPHAMEVCGPYGPPMFPALDGHPSSCWLLRPWAADAARQTRLLTETAAGR